MRWNIIVECVGEDGKRSTITLGTIERLAASTTAENLGVNLRESKQIANRLQDTVVKQQLQEHCEQRRKCLTCEPHRAMPRQSGRRRLYTSLTIGHQCLSNWRRFRSMARILPRFAHGRSRCSLEKAITGRFSTKVRLRDS